MLQQTITLNAHCAISSGTRQSHQGPYLTPWTAKKEETNGTT